MSTSKTFEETWEETWEPTSVPFFFVDPKTGYEYVITQTIYVPKVNAAKEATSVKDV